MKPCPFCGGEGRVVSDEIINENEGYDNFPYVVCRCVTCNSLSEKINIEYFNCFSEHTVDDFRKSNLLRAKEDLRYREYIDSRKAAAVDKWNKRSE